MPASPKFDTSPGDVGLRVTVHNEVDGQTTDLLFSEFPVRIGRNKLNELVLNHPFVSQWHAVIGFVRGALSVIQVGSTNSVQVSGRKLAPNDELALQRDETIRIVPFEIQLQLVSLPTDHKKKRNPTSSLVHAAASSGSDEAALGRIALQLVDRLGSRFLGVTFDDPRQLALFGTRLEETLDVCLRCLVALKKGQEQFRNTLDIRALQSRRDDAVERAANPEELAAALLTPEGGDATSLERAFKDIMIHQVALLNGLMAGVRNLLGKISPKTVHKEASRQHRSPNWRMLWEAFERIHRDLAEEEHATFETIFGRQFDKAYSTVAIKKK